MSGNIQESDWKKIRTLKENALNIASERTLQNVENLVKSRGAESYKYYQKLWKLLREKDKEISLMFDDLKRSNAILKLSAWRKYGVLSDETLQELSEETQKRIESFFQIVH